MVEHTFVGNETQVVPEQSFEEKAAMAEDLAMSKMVSTFVGNETVVAPPRSGA